MDSGGQSPVIRRDVPHAPAGFSSRRGSAPQTRIGRGRDSDDGSGLWRERGDGRSRAAAWSVVNGKLRPVRCVHAPIDSFTYVRYIFFWVIDDGSSPSPGPRPVKELERTDTSGAFAKDSECQF